MMDETRNALDTLFVPFETGRMQRPLPPARILFLNAQDHVALKSFSPEYLVLQQYFKPYAQILERRGYKVVCDLPLEKDVYDLACVALPKNQVESAALLARALESLKTGGTMIAAADNKAGGGRIEKMFENFGLRTFQSLSKNKARVVWAPKGDVDRSATQHAIDQGAPQKILGGEFVSWPGIFGWNKVDVGSACLLKHISPDLKGRGADFGCGYGFLSRAIVQQKNVTALICIDADFRALQMCRQNLERPGCNIKPDFLWADLRTAVPSLKNLDFIVMNPPFHEGKGADVKIGTDFIQVAAQSLRTGGMLWMVANTHLPYETPLGACFSRVQKIFEGNGFKVFCAVK